VKNSLIKEKLKNLDIHYKHPSYALECKLLKEIRQGYLSSAAHTLKEINALEKPILARDSIRSTKNSLIGSCTLFTRAVIEAGVNSEDAFDLSDVFIKHIESLDKKEDLIAFEYEMLETCIKLIQNAVIFNYPFPISKVAKHIYENATSKITVSTLAELTHLSPDYLSKLFYKEVGMSITDYIQKQKVEVAKNFLEFSQMKVTDIATLLEFCNPGYFSNVFKNHTGMSPALYRKSTSIDT
jgi:YesN/AraC family two-component response regulator